MKNVCIAMSGGVDSSVAAFLLKEKGYNCRGVYMITREDYSVDMRDAEKIAALMGIEIDVLDLREDFKEILEYFSSEYQKARTPNPCVYCNKVIKFGRLWQHAQSKGCDYLATGHYIRKENGLIYTGKDIRKDQSYVLALIDPQVAGHTVFPNGKYVKQQIRQIAADNGFPVAEKAESQEICFIPDDDYAGCLEKLCPEIIKEGNIVHSSGKILDKHNGIYRYTIGQRRGLRVAMGTPVYVTALDAETNTVTLGSREELMANKCITSNVNWLTNPPKEPFDAVVKIRYNSPGVAATVRTYPADGDKDGLEITFAEDVSAVTPGQLAAVYIPEGDRMYLLGGGWIKSASKSETA